MQKTWNVTLYSDGKPVSERRGVSQSDAVAQIYRLARTSAPVEFAEVEEIAAPRTEERELVAA
jgi:hypothetical protein